MNSQRLLILMFAAALTAGTAGATTVLYDVEVGSDDQFLTCGGTLTAPGPGSCISVGGIQLSDTYGPGDNYGFNLTVTNSWQAIEIDYSAYSGANGLTFWAGANGSSYVPLANLASSDANGISIIGLHAAYYTYSGTPTATDYGEGPIQMVAGTGDWYGFSPTAQFKEVLTGYIWTGLGAPDLTTVPGYVAAGSGDTGGAAPEPAGWWLMAAALPLMLVSKLRLSRAVTRD